MTHYFCPLQPQQTLCSLKTQQPIWTGPKCDSGGFEWSVLMHKSENKPRSKFSVNILIPCCSYRALSLLFHTNQLIRQQQRCFQIVLQCQQEADQVLYSQFVCGELPVWPQGTVCLGLPVWSIQHMPTGLLGTGLYLACSLFTWSQKPWPLMTIHVNLAVKVERY